MTASERPDKAADRTDRKIDMARDDDEQHSKRHDDDIAVLQNEIGEVQRLHENAAGHDLEEDHDCNERKQHPGFTQIVLEIAPHAALLAALDYILAHYPFPLFRMMARMMFSCVASSPATSPTKAPSCMTTMRSQMPISSGISEEMTTTPLPLSASELMIV